MPAERQLAELENTLVLIKLDPSENAACLAPLLDIPLSSERAPALAPEELRRRQLAALINLIMAGARSQPVVLVLEDVHWADPTTLDFVRGLVSSVALSPLCFSLSQPAPNFARLGQFAHITPRFPSPRLIAHRCTKW